jgi:signal transduction histidine kinase
MASVDQLNALIGDILDVVRLNQGKMTFHATALNASPIIEKVIESFQYVAHEKGLEISYEKKDLPNINVDAEKLRQILVNIIGNSIKYTPAGSVKVFAETEHGILSIRVRDTGIGISAEDQKSLFGKFFRVKSKDTEDIRGTGLGLWIAAQVIDNMGGKISVESIKGKGTDFVISFSVVK